MAGLEPAAIGSIPPCSTIVWATRPYNTVFGLVRLTHSCARNADLTSSGHAVWPSLLHRPLIRSVTASLILLQASLITSSWWEFMWIFRAWITTFLWRISTKFNYQIDLHIGGPGLNWTGAHGASIRCSTDWATEPRYLVFLCHYYDSRGVCLPAT